MLPWRGAPFSINHNRVFVRSVLLMQSVAYYVDRLSLTGFMTLTGIHSSLEFRVFQINGIA
jgi:hypothetical protein